MKSVSASLYSHDFLLQITENLWKNKTIIIHLAIIIYLFAQMWYFYCKACNSSKPWIILRLNHVFKYLAMRALKSG